MFINSITLNNFRIYKGNNEINFTFNPDKNIFVVAGNNGYGKTSFLTSLVWCLYGKRMQDVDNAHKSLINEYGGYKNFAISNLNHLAASEGKNSYYVSMTFENFKIPTIQCNEVVIKREYNAKTEKENLIILIDGFENELTREVGSEIFINDYVLPKEIAKFFFFDSEKIVNLADLKSLEEKRNLSKAYSEVLGIKKYEDLRENLKDLRLRLKRESANYTDRQKITTLQKELKDRNELIEFNRRKIETLEEERINKKYLSDQLQEKLVREGQALSIEELNKLRKESERLIENSKILKKKLTELIEFVPFALVMNKMKDISVQIDIENEINDRKSISSDLIDTRIKNLFNKKETQNLLERFISSKKQKEFLKEIKSILNKSFVNSESYPDNSESQILHAFTKEEQSEFFSIYNNLQHFFKDQFKILNFDYQQNQIEQRQINKRLSDAEKKEDDLIISSYRTQKEDLEISISQIDGQIIRIQIEIEAIERDLNVKSKQISELARKINLDSDNFEKDKTSEILLSKLDEFIVKFKKEKKNYLEKRILDGLKILMHKKDFVKSVTVDISNDFIEIKLSNNLGEIINNEELSKGEQQLFATAVLKALVEESNIKFPVFIDSPLQKFDTSHSKNVIKNFYPTISDQVVICPLLGKELSESEYDFMKENVENSYLISNVNDNHSEFSQVLPYELFNKFQEQI